MAKSMRRVRDLKMKAQEGRCHYCGRPMWAEEPEVFAGTFGLTPGQAAMLRCTAEHLKPRSEGGGNGVDNIVAACRFCNATRHKARKPRDPDAYRELVRRRLASGRWLRVGKIPTPAAVPAR